MGGTPTRPCAPPLTLVPNGGPGSAFPPPLTSDDIPIQDSNPGFGDLATQILGDAGDNADGFDLAVEATSAVIDALDAAIAVQDADLDAILALLAAADSSSVDQSFTDYQGTFPAGAAIVAGAQALAPPDVTTGAPQWITTPLPPDTGGAAAGCAKGTVVSGLTIGTPDPATYPTVPGFSGLNYHTKYPVMCTGDPPVKDTVQTGTLCYDHSNWGDAALVYGDSAIFSHEQTHINDDGKCWIAHVNLIITPAKAGKFSAVIQFDAAGGNAFGGPHYWQYDVTIVAHP